MNDRPQRNLIAAAAWTLRYRPAYFWRAARGYALFYRARWLRAFLPLERVRLEANVRLQRNSSLMAERPGASISIGADSIIYEDASIEAYGEGTVEIGAGAIIGAARIVSRHGVHVGQRFLSSWNVFIQDFDPHPLTRELRACQVQQMLDNFRPRFAARPARAHGPMWDFPGAEIIIGDDVWVGAGATILKGARIGSGSIISCGAVVLKGEYAPASLIAGNPARVVRDLSHGGVSRSIGNVDDTDHIGSTIR